MKRRPVRQIKPPTAPPAARPPEAAPPEAAEFPAPAVCVELGNLRIHVERAADLDTVLQPLLRVASQKNLSQLLGISTRTLHRWQRTRRVPAVEGQTLAQIVGRMVTIPGSGA